MGFGDGGVGETIEDLAVFGLQHHLAVVFKVRAWGNVQHADQGLGQDGAVAHVVQGIVVAGQGFGEIAVGEQGQ